MTRSWPERVFLEAAAIHVEFRLTDVVVWRLSGDCVTVSCRKRLPRAANPRWEEMALSQSRSRTTIAVHAEFIPN